MIYDDVMRKLEESKETFAPKQEFNILANDGKGLCLITAFFQGLGYTEERRFSEAEIFEKIAEVCYFLSSVSFFNW